MQKVYLLLRNNRQTGPYSLEELLGLQLKPFDLVWVEGRSAAWQYPAEIPALRSFVPDTPRAENPFQPIQTEALEKEVPQKPASRPEPSTLSSAKVFVRMPQPAVPPAPAMEPVRSSPSIEPPLVEPPMPSAMPSLSEPAPLRNERFSSDDADVRSWNYHPPQRKKKSLGKKDLVLTALLIGVLAGGYYLMSRPEVLPRTSARSAVPIPSTAATPSAEGKATLEEQKPETGSQPYETPTAGQATNPALPKAISRKQTAASVRKANLPVGNETAETKTAAPAVKEPAAPDETSATPDVTQNASKKKNLGTVIRGIFKKNKEKDPAPAPSREPVVLETPRPATNRQATRRSDEGNAEASAPEATESEPNLMDQVDLSSNAPDNWMMGVSGLKVTLRNRSGVLLGNATVQVLYYDANNGLLEKKNLNFSNVPARGKATLPAPDHKYADHVELKLAAVNAGSRSTAKN